MLTFSLPDQGISLSLPEESSGTENPQAPLTIKVNHDGSIKLNNKSIGYDSLLPELKREMAKRNDKALSVDVHKKVEYDVFVQVLDLSKKAGVESFSIIH
jgi:biopolymer transport protein ExbD